MTRHQRCLAAIAGEPVDRPPKYLPGIACDVSSALLGRPVHTGVGSLHYAESLAWMGGDAAHADFEAQLYEDLAALFRLLNIDVYRMPWRHTWRPTRQLDEYTFLYGDPEGAYAVYRYNPETTDFGPIEQATPADGLSYEERVRRSIEAGEQTILDGALDRTVISSAEHRMLCRRFGEEFFVVCNGGGMGVGWDADALELLLTDPELSHRQLMLQACQAVALGAALQLKGCPGVLVAGGDMAGNDGPFYSPATFRAVMLPAVQWMCRELATLDVHYIFRSDGNLWPVADMLFGEAACPGYGEVDRDAGMTVGKLRERFPHLVLWGNMSVSRLASASPAWVRDETRRVIAESGSTGYFHGPSNAIMHGTPPDNVIALFDIEK